MATATKDAADEWGAVLDNSGLHHLAEAATALTQLGYTAPLSPQSKRARPHTVSDDDEHSSAIEADASVHKEEASTSSPKCIPENTNLDGSKQIFPQRLMHILNETSISDVITWLPHGQSFVIVKPTVFTEEILPLYFPESCGSCSEKKSLKTSNSSTCKYPSFTRKLNRWGFRQVSRGADAGAFQHKLFQRDKPDTCLHMVCQRSRRRKSEKKAEDEKSDRSDRSCIEIPVASQFSTKIIPTLSNSKRKLWSPRGTLVTDSESDTSSLSILHDEAKSLPPKKRKHCVNMNGSEAGTFTYRSTTPPRSNHCTDYSMLQSSPIKCSIGSNSPGELAIQTVEGKTTPAAPITTTPLLQPSQKTYLNANALLEHNIALNNIHSLNAAVAIAQVHTQHASLPITPSLLENLAVLTNNTSTQIAQNMNPPNLTISSALSSKNMIKSSQQTLKIVEKTSDVNTEHDAQERAVNAKKMLYSAFLQALK